MADSQWRAIPCSRRQIRLDVVLQCGQSFRWRKNDKGEWLGVLSGLVWRLKQDDTHVYYQVYSRETSLPEIKTETKLSLEEDTKPHMTDAQRDQAQHIPLEASRRSRTSTHKSHSLTNDELLPEETKVKREKSDCSMDSQPESFGTTPTEGAEVSVVKSEPIDTDAILQDYFQLNVDTDALYRQWSDADPYFRQTARDFWGVRILRQDPVENLFSLICSSNNHISRISSMVENLCIQYGEPIAEVDGKLYHSFPLIASLAQPGVEETLRELGFGYRAKFIAASAKYIMDKHSQEWVSSLRHCTYDEARTELRNLLGVGRKVADCVCLMSLDKTAAIPVDTHMRKVAARHYLPGLPSGKSITDKLYQQISDHFRKRWGQYAGWAQSVLFTAELRHMKDLKTSPGKTLDIEEDLEMKSESATGEVVQSAECAKAFKRE